MKNLRTKTSCFLSFCAMTVLFMVALAPPVNALPTLKLTSGDVTVQIEDGGSGDLLADSGGVTFSGDVGIWNINVTTGLTKPAEGDAINAYMDISSLNRSSDTASGDDDLIISFSEDSFLGSSSMAGAELSIGGTINADGGTLTAAAYHGSALFDDTTPIGSALTFVGGGAFSGSTSGTIPTSGLYSLTQIVTISHDAAGATSFDFELRAVPEPGTILLLGSGLAGLGFFLRRRRSH